MGRGKPHHIPLGGISLIQNSSLFTPFEDQLVEGEVLRAALARLSPDDVACLLLNTLEGYTAAQIAEIVGIAPEAAKKRLARAKERLRVAYARQNQPSWEEQ